MTSLNIVILAAGKGTRMYSARPKVLHALAGKPLLAHVLAAAVALAPRQVCVVYGHGGEAVPQAMSGYAAQFVLQEPQLGTGHAVQQALPHLPDEGRTLVLYGDVPLIQHATLHQMQQAGEGLVLLTVHMANPAGYGRIVRDPNGDVLAIVEEKDATPEQREITEVNTGILLAPTARLRAWLTGLRNHNAQGEYYLTDIVAMAVADGVPVHAAHPAHAWEVEGVNSKTQLAQLERTWQHEVATRLLAQGVTLADPARLDVRGTLSCGQDVEIDVGCVFEGEVELGDRVQVGPYTVLKNMRVGAGTRIEAYSHLADAEIGADCRIGPFARIRPGSMLEGGVHIGNFVEVKNSRIAEGSKANHLAYVGDASVGRSVNIGAGAITANYDGANKHRTEIGDAASVGANCVLVAPVVVGEGATIGAGSVVTRQAPAGELTVARARAVTIPGWKRPRKAPK
ncbi:MAG TPA: bifunctional UDP-N-acetylglucosamine diphosphorylase/glucosamine-1-phosphate N-acetyltransferase GlmU [Gallionellaceae bacterium]|nr:bifunctional UDP-N-acetylglucosamine diphosphorylase/glucosamine-1-phosphate N-acetyltransferase GlmU [Gallionellaceae bacterium]